MLSSLILPSTSFADNSTTFQPGIDLSTQTVWDFSQNSYQFGADKTANPGADLQTPEALAIQVLNGEKPKDSTVLNMAQGGTVFETGEGKIGVGLLASYANLTVNGDIGFTGLGYEAMAVMVVEASDLTINGALTIDAFSTTSPVLPLILSDSNVSIDSIRIKSGGSLAVGGVPGLPHSGATFVMASGGSLTSENVFLEVREDNKGPIYGLNVDDAEVHFSNFNANLVNKYGGIAIGSMSNSNVKFDSVALNASCEEGSVTGFTGTGGMLTISGGTIDLSSQLGDAKAVEVGSAQLDNLEVNVKASNGFAQGLHFVDDTVINNVSLTVEGSNGYIYGIETAGYDGKGFITITNLEASVKSSQGKAYGLLINRGAKVSNLTLNVTPGEEQIGIGLATPMKSVDLDTISISVNGTKGYGIVATENSWGSGNSSQINLKGVNTITAANALASSPYYNQDAGDNYKTFELNVLEGESSFIGSIAEFQGTFNAVGGTTVFSDTTLNGNFNIGNAIVVFGDENSNKVNAIKKENGLQTPLLYVAKPIMLNKGAHLTVGLPTEPATLLEAVPMAAGEELAQNSPTSSVVINKGSTVVFNNSADSYAFSSDDDGATFTVKEGALLLADNLVVGQDVNIAKFANPIEIEEGAEVKPLSRLFDLKLKKDPQTGEYVMEVSAAPAIEPETPAVRNLTTLIPNSVLATAYGAQGIGAERILELSDITNGLTDKQFVEAINKIALMGTAGAAQNISINTASLIGDTLTRHGSVLAGSTHEKNGADLWIDINGSFSKASSLAAGSESYGYKSDMSLITIGSDYAFGNGLAAGAAVNFGKGSVRGQGAGAGTKNKVGFWGLNAYGVWSTEYANLIGSVGYLESNNKITQSGYKGKPKVKAFTAEVRAEKPIAVSETFSVTPHVGLRYVHLDTDSFSAGGFKYGFEKANLGQVPVGVAFNANLKTSGGVNVVPFVDLEIAPAFGNKKVKHTVALENSSARDSFNSTIGANALYTGRVGVSAVKGNHSLGFSYGATGGNDGRVDQNLKAQYRYQF